MHEMIQYLCGDPQALSLTAQVVQVRYFGLSLLVQTDSISRQMKNSQEKLYKINVECNAVLVVEQLTSESGC